MSFFIYYFEKILGFLQARPFTGGLEISDSSLHFAYFDGRKWQMVSLRLPPGVVTNSQISDYDQFVQILKKLKEEVFGGRYSKQRISVVVSLASSNIYTQVFTLPILKGKSLEEAIQLNIQMASPADVSQTYSGWQVAGEDKEGAKLDVLSAFINRDIVDKIHQALSEAGFPVMAVESRAMSLTRLVREQGRGLSAIRPYVILSLDNESLDFLVVRRGQLYFEYLNSWRDLRGEATEISISDFRAVITRNLRQVLNYYSQHWTEPVGEVILVTHGLEEEVKKIINENFSLQARKLELRFDQPVGGEWFAALGGGVRAIGQRRSDQDISLLGVSARDEFKQERIISFANFWRVTVPTALTLLLIVLIAVTLFLTQMSQSLESQSLGLKDDEKLREVEGLRREAVQFNQAVAEISSVRRTDRIKSLAIERLTSLLDANNLTLSRFSLKAFGTPVTLYGEAKSEGDILNFQRDLEADPHFKEVELFLTDVRPGPQGFTFSIIFSMAPVSAN